MKIKTFTINMSKLILIASYLWRWCDAETLINPKEIVKNVLKNV
jgi:hypothetical protein